MTAPTRKPSVATQWHPHYSHTESAVLDMANSRQIALRTRLRNFYWLTDCKPFGTDSVTMTRKKMIMIDSKDKMTDADVADVLTAHYGFVASPGGWTIPELDEARGIAIRATEARAERAGAGGRAKAAKAKESKEVTTASGDPHDF